MSQNRYYVVWNGRETGIFSSWDTCLKQIDGYKGALYKGFKSRAEAEYAFSEPYKASIGIKNRELSAISTRPTGRHIAVDAACSGNPGDMEYRGVWIDSGEEIFRSKIYKMGTNNIGEFLAIVHALALCKQKEWNCHIYSDSVNAQLWTKQKKSKTKLTETPNNAELFNLLDRAEVWLSVNSYQNKIVKWDTKNWGEIPADFGRK